MSKKDISQSPNPDLRATMGALKRSAALAREIAIQTNTNLVIFENGEIVRLSPDQLREEARKAKLESEE